MFRISEKKLYSQMREHCEGRNTLLFEHFEKYFEKVFMKKSEEALDYISEVFAGAQDNLKRKKVQMEDKKRNAHDAQQNIQFLKGSLLENTKNKHDLFMQSLRITTDNDDSPTRYVLTKGYLLPVVLQSLRRQQKASELPPQKSEPSKGFVVVRKRKDAYSDDKYTTKRWDLLGLTDINPIG
eukprot:TRINITY_DN3413_c0_g1_i3.p1 TRINITY_DN3413_c0_g1~~TRINITY_DN3413_c0_g1_i3.p1  ORF type:complete len:182 (-),score=38.58 TRINITY_DN3413_c0_g1_i3:77-622(-)